MARGQGLSITTIIIAALGLLVLIVLIAIFTGKVQMFGKGIGETTEAKPCPGDIKPIAECSKPIYDRFSDEQLRDNPNLICCEKASSP